ncbi:MAG: hypothetical protein PHP62_03010 [Candidatus Moranbacteria bacterium]|nr:hypothetical protein [Candidatus Moranbacteria bacterium]
MADKQKVFVPEEHFSEVPNSFSGESIVTKVKSDIHSEGIILNSIKEVELALRIHNGEVSITPLSSMVTNINLVNDMFEHVSPMAAGMVAMASETLMKGKDFVGTIVAEAKCHLATNGKYHRHFDYDGMGSNFLKTSVTVTKVEDKFVLNISGCETPIAVLLGRRISLSVASIRVSLSVVDDWWYNVNLKKVLGGIGYLDPEFDPTWPQLAEVLADGKQYFHLPILKKGIPLSLLIGIDRDRYRYKSSEEGNERDERDLIKAIDGNITGAAWSPYRREGSEATVKNRELEVKLIFPDRSYGSPPVIDPEHIAALSQTAREIEEQLLKEVA